MTDQLNGLEQGFIAGVRLDAAEVDALFAQCLGASGYRLNVDLETQTITRPDGTPIRHTTIPFMVGAQSTTNIMNEGYQQDRMADMLVQADEMQNTIDNMSQMQSITEQMAATTHDMVTKMKDMTAADLDAAVRTIAGSARSMGVNVEGV